MSWADRIPDDTITVICIDMHAQMSTLSKRIACSFAGSNTLDESAAIFAIRANGEIRVVKARYGIRITGESLSNIRGGSNGVVYERDISINQH